MTWQQRRHQSEAYKSTMAKVPSREKQRDLELDPTNGSQKYYSSMLAKTNEGQDRAKLFSLFSLCHSAILFYVCFSYYGLQSTWPGNVNVTNCFYSNLPCFQIFQHALGRWEKQSHFWEIPQNFERLETLATLHSTVKCLLRKFNSD